MSTPQTVLVIDDSDDDHYIARYVIGRCWPDAVILTAMDGQSALDLIAEQPRSPDIVFLDIRMPNSDGIDFLERWAPNASDTPIVVVLTAHAQEADRERASRYDCVRDFVTKPLTVEKIERLNRLVTP